MCSPSPIHLNAVLCCCCFSFNLSTLETFSFQKRGEKRTRNSDTIFVHFSLFLWLHIFAVAQHRISSLRNPHRIPLFSPFAPVCAVHPSMHTAQSQIKIEIKCTEIYSKIYVKRKRTFFRSNCIAATTAFFIMQNNFKRNKFHHQFNFRVLVDMKLLSENSLWFGTTNVVLRVA